MKRILFTILVTLCIASLYAPAIALADAPAPAPASTSSKKVDEILPTDASKGHNLSVGDLMKQVVPKGIQTFLALVGTISFCVFVYAGAMLVISQGNEEDVTKFKNILIWSLVGLALIAGSYALVSGLMQLRFS